MAEALFVVAPLLQRAALVGNEIYNMIQCHGEKNGALKEVEGKVQLVISVLHLVEQNIESVQVDILQSVVMQLEDLREEVKRVKKMKRLVYVLQAKDCQEKLRHKVDTIQLYLNSLHFNQTNSVYSQIEEIKKLLRHDWESVVGDDEALLDLQQTERQEYQEFKSQVEAKKLQIELLQRLGLSTKKEVEEALKQTEEEHQRRVMLAHDPKTKVEAEYLQLVIELLSATEIPLPKKKTPKKKTALKKKTKLEKKKKEKFDPTCPVCMGRFIDPVIVDCECKGTIDKICFEKWRSENSENAGGGKLLCPVCGLPLQSLQVSPNVHLKEWLRLHPSRHKDRIKWPKQKPGNDAIIFPSVNKAPRDEPVILPILPLANRNVDWITPPNTGTESDPVRVQDPIRQFRPDPPNMDLINAPDPDIENDPSRVSLYPPNMDPIDSPGLEHEHKPFCTKRRLSIALLLLLLIGVTVGIVIGVLGNEPKPAPSPSDESNPTPSPSDESNPTPSPSVESKPTQSPFCQIGLDLVSDTITDSSAIVALSANGSRVAIGAPDNDAGHVSIFDWSGSDWKQVGSDINGEAADDLFGFSVALSADGMRVAIGAPWNDGNGEDAGHVRIFELSGSVWTQVGSDINGGAADNLLGQSVALSSDGNRVAIGAVGRDYSGSVRIYDWLESNWTQVGPVIHGEGGEAAVDSFGMTVALSSDGSRVAVGAPQFDSVNALPTDYPGYVLIFDWSKSNWTKVGPVILGDSAGDAFGSTVALSSDGSRVAIGAPEFKLDKDSTAGSGYVQILDRSLSSNKWEPAGDAIRGEADGDSSGWGLALSANGSRVAIGADYNAGNGDKAGHVRIFDWSESQWKQVGSDIDGKAAGDAYGAAVALSDDGTLVAIGTRASHAVVYDLMNTSCL